MTMPDGTLDAVALLEAAAARLRDKGWRRYGAGPLSGPNCLMGALEWAAFDHQFAVPVRRGALKALGKQLDGSITEWNDYTCPSAAAAADALLNAAKAVAARATPAA